MKSLSDLGGLVYSTDTGRMCPGCRQPVAQCQCKCAHAVPVGDGVVRVSGVLLDAAALVLLGKQLKAACGSGGTVKDGVIEVQGDHTDRVVLALKKLGYTAKRAGG